MQTPVMHEPIVRYRRTTGVKRLAVLAGALAGLLLVPAVASAHPLGNFTINRYAGIEVAGDAIYVRYALDVAEIPTIQLGGQLRAKGYPARLARELELTLDGRRAPLRVVEGRVRTRPVRAGCRRSGWMSCTEPRAPARRSRSATARSREGSAGAR